MALKRSSRVLQSLREYMGQQKLDALVIPSGDAHMSEYIAACDERRKFVSGFTGSAGTALITQEAACLWTDGRYYSQALAQLDDSWTLMKDGLPDTPTQAEWLRKVFSPGQARQVGVDSYVMSAASWKQMVKQLKVGGGHITLTGLTTNPVDLIWSDRPPRPHNPITVQPDNFSGRSWQDKIAAVRDKMSEKDVGVLLVSALDQVAWTLNLRGSDINYNPVFFSYLITTGDAVHLFLESSTKLSAEVRDHLGLDRPGAEIPVQVRPYEEIASAFSEILRDLEKNGGEATERPCNKVWVCERTVSQALVDLVPKPLRIIETSPIAAMKAVKNDTEIKGMVDSHIRDAVALCQYLAWLEKEIHSGNLTEILASDKLEDLRSKQDEYVGLSFATISAIGEHGAVIHYQASPETDHILTPDKLYLCDSGAQFRDGTTDVTRTVHFATPSQHEKECFTRVLKGHIGLATVVFPNNVKGSRLDALARMSLWAAGLDYQHGTGHGVGSFLNVHEGPCGISYRGMPYEIPLKDGMILSNEPGYYEDGKFGIRIENLVVVRKADTKYNFMEKGFLQFETITVVPIQTKMIVPEMLSDAEICWLNDYHTKCRETTGEALKAQGHMDAYTWLMRETEPLQRQAANSIAA